MNAITEQHALVAWFDHHGFTLDHFEASDDFNELYQFDGGFDGIIIQIQFGINAAGAQGVFGDITLANGDIYSISCRLSEWRVNYESQEYIDVLSMLGRR